MTESSNNSTVSIVAILAIVVLVAGGFYFVWSQRSGDATPTIEIDVDGVFRMDEPGAMPVTAFVSFPGHWIRA